jgi:hypothetical protein
MVLSVVEARDIARFKDLSEQRLAAAIELDDGREKALALVQTVGEVLLSDRTRAIANAEEALRLARELANPNVLTYAPMTVGRVIADTDPSRAEALLDEAIRTAGALQNHFAEIRARQFLGRVRTLYGDHVQAGHAYLESAELANRVGDRLALFHSVGGIACNLAELGDQEPALLLAAWVEDRGHWPPDWAIHPPFGPSSTLAHLQTESNSATRQQLQERTESMSDVEAIALARASLEALSQD